MTRLNKSIRHLRKPCIEFDSPILTEFTAKLLYSFIEVVNLMSQEITINWLYFYRMKT